MKSEAVETVMRVSSKFCGICNSHAQEDCHCPVPEFLGDHEDGDFRLVFAGEM